MSQDLFKDLEYRGIVKQVTDPGLERALRERKVTLYIGFDPTSDSLHVGNLLGILTLRRFQQAGHRVIAVVGGATGMIGDPSGKSQERTLLTEDQLAHNLRGITAVLSRFLDLKDSKKGIVANNADWFKGMDYIRFLRDVGKHFTINHMMAKESVRARLEDREHGISYTEFSYMLLQAYDFHVLHEREGCTLQAGGSDQWGNITAGVELIRRMRAAEGKNAAEVFGLTHPLVTKSDGTKFGKSEKGNLWLDAARTHANEFYQFFVQTADADVITYLKFFTFLSKAEIELLESELKSKPEARAAQKALARELTRLVHGDEALAQAEQTAGALFSGSSNGTGKGSLLSLLGKLDVATAAIGEAVAKQIPGLATTQIPRDKLGLLTLVELLVETKLSASKGAARRDIEDGGISVNEDRIKETSTVIDSKMLKKDCWLLLQKGKKTHHFVYFH